MTSQFPSRIGRYQVIDRLGVGGMGAVYSATDPLLGRTIAVKILHSDDEDVRERFEREARSVAALRHQHIVTVFDVGEDEGRPFLAMEFLDGESVAEIIRRRAPIGLDVRLELIGQLCAGLGYAHRQGIIHRDIKPANLMVTSESVLKIVDFGLARVTAGASSLTQAGMLLGTPHYMSPEQIEGRAVNHLSDIFSVGLVLYEILSYRKAFVGDSTPAILHSILHSVPQPIRGHLSGIDPELERIVTRAVERPLDRRYQDLRMLAADLERVRARIASASDDDTIIAERPSEATGGKLASGSGKPSKPAVSPDGPTPAGGVRGGRNLDVVVQKRAASIARYLAAASEHLNAQRFEEAVEQCEQALLIDPQQEHVLEMLEQAQRAIDDNQVERWIAEAKGEISQGSLTRAEELIEQVLRLRTDSSQAATLRQQIRDERTARERAADRARAAQSAVERARRNLRDGALEAAVRAAAEALAYDSAHGEAQTLKRKAMAALEERRQQQERDQAANDIAAQARDHADHGDHTGALALLRGFIPRHATVDEAILEIEGRVAALEQQRREEEERARQRALEDARRREQLAAARIEAEGALERGDYQGARAVVQGIRESLTGDPEAERFCRQADTAADVAEGAARLRAVVQGHLSAAETAIVREDLATALTSVEAALNLAPDEREALRLLRDVRVLIETRRREDRQRQEAEAAVTTARTLVAAGRIDDAIRGLATFRPSPLVASVLQELREQSQRLEQDQLARERVALEEQERQARAQAAREEGARLERERVIREQAAREAQQREARDKAAAEESRRLQEERSAREQAAREKRERLERERVTRERAAREAQEKEARDKAATEESNRLERERLAREQAAREQAAREQAAREQAAREKRQRLERERVEQARAEHLRAEQALAERARQERQQAQAERERAEKAQRKAEEHDEREGQVRPHEEQPRTGVLRRRTIAAGAAAAVLITAMAGGWWLLSRDTDVPPQPPPAVDYGPVIQQARAQYARGDVSGAITGALSLPLDAPERGEALAFLQTIRNEAAARAQSERQRAESAGKTSEADFQRAVEKDQQAARGSNPAETLQVVTLYEEARALYSVAASAGSSPTEYLQMARRERAANRIPQAIEYAVQALAKDARYPDAIAFLRGVREESARQASAAGRAARQSGANPDSSPAFKEAAAQEALANGLRDVKETRQAYDAFVAARTRYEEAVRDSETRAAEKSSVLRAHLERAEQALKSGDIASATAALEQAERVSRGDPAIAEMRTRLKAPRGDDATKDTTERERREVGQLLADAARIANDSEAMKVLTNALNRYPGYSAEISGAVAKRKEARDERIADLVRRARNAGDAEAIQLLDEAFAIDPSRGDVRTERDRRRTAATAARVERDVRDALVQWEAAYERLNAADLVKIDTSRTFAEVDKDFKGYRSAALEIQSPIVTVDSSGSTATVTCSIRRVIQPRIAASRIDDTRAWQFRLVNANGSWQIVAAAPR